MSRSAGSLFFRKRHAACLLYEAGGSRDFLQRAATREEPHNEAYRDAWKAAKTPTERLRQVENMALDGHMVVDIRRVVNGGPNRRMGCAYREKERGGGAMDGKAAGGEGCCKCV